MAPTKLEKDAAAAGLSVEDFKALQAAAASARGALSDEDRKALEEREKAANAAIGEAAELRAKLAEAEKREASAAEKTADLEGRLAALAVTTSGATVGGTVTTNARGEQVTE